MIVQILGAAAREQALKRLNRHRRVERPKTRGVVATGIYTGPIKSKDNLADIIIKSCLQDPALGAKIRIGNRVFGGKFKDGDIIAVTEAVVASDQNNFCSYEAIGKDFEHKFNGAKHVVVLLGLPSRNRTAWLKAIMAAKSLEEITLVFTYPRDEMGNSLFLPSDQLDDLLSSINPNEMVYTYEELCEKFGKPCHQFTGVDYPEMYIKMCAEANLKCNILFCNNYDRIKEYTDCQNYLVARTHDRNNVARKLRNSGIQNVLTLADLMNESVDGSGYNENFGLLGCNHWNEESIKLFPRECEKFVKDLQQRIRDEYGAQVEVMVFGDGAFCDPVGHIWELADPVVSPGYTDGLKGTNAGQAKAKKLIGENPDATTEELTKIIEEARTPLDAEKKLDNKNALGTTPRRITDLVGSLCDLVTGSGDRMTPVVHIRGYLQDYKVEKPATKKHKHVFTTTLLLMAAAVTTTALVYNRNGK